MLSCSSGDDPRREGHKIIKLLIQDLQKIRTRDDLLVVEPLLEKHFLKLAQVMIGSRERDGEGELKESDHILSEQLRVQLNRVYHIEGGREIIERTQVRAIELLN